LTETAEAAPAVVVLADDLIWASRLTEALTEAGARPRRVRRLEDLVALLDGGVAGEPAGDRPALAIVDLTARAYDGVEAVRAASAAGARVIAVGQHDDVESRRAARQAGASRVHPYRALFEHGDRELGAWISGLVAGTEEER
jgi:DNA-binding response OmpR family regulator